MKSPKPLPGCLYALGVLIVVLTIIMGFIKVMILIGKVIF